MFGYNFVFGCGRRGVAIVVYQWGLSGPSGIISCKSVVQNSFLHTLVRTI